MLLDPALLRSRHTVDLFDEWLPFFDKYVIDHQRGGFPSAVHPDGTRAGDGRQTWFEGRGLWVYSHLYTTLAPEQHYLDIATQALALLERSRPAGTASGRPRLLDANGDPVGPADPEVYSDLFVAEGLAAYSGATGEASHWDHAAAIVRECVERFADPDYRAALHYVLTPDERALNSADCPGTRPLGVWMLLVRTLSELLTHRADQELAAQLRAAVDVVLTRYLDPRFDLLREVLDHDLRHSPAPRFVYLGHAIETLWMMLDAALLLDDQELFDRASAVFRRHCEVARDPVYGGLFRALVDVDEARYTLDKTLWVQHEAMIGALLLVEHRADPWAAQLFTELDDYVHERFPLREPGAVLWREQSDRIVSTRQSAPRAENYHHPRWLMRVLETADRLEGSSR